MAAAASSDSDSLPAWWIVIFLLLALGAGALTVLSVGGSLVSSPGFVLPVLF